MIGNEFSSHKFCLKHGSLFILHPRDEITMLRTIFDEYCSTYFKHGNVFFGKDGISIGLAFRTTFRTANVNAAMRAALHCSMDTFGHTSCGWRIPYGRGTAQQFLLVTMVIKAASL